MMKTNMTKNSMIKPLTFAIALAMGVVATTTLAADAMEANSNTQEAYDTSWQTPLAAEFSRLDTTGNGLLLPNEASKGKAFNKQTFAKADADKDGYIDQNEYIYFKTGKWPEVTQPVDTEATLDNPSMSEPVMMAATETEAAAPAKRSVGEVIDDSVITTKAKAEILRTKELKSLQISVETRQGEVLLSGFVDNEAAKMKAEEVVSKIEGVKSVTNGLEIRT
jgi:hyperosmotically inducible protein